MACESWPRSLNTSDLALLRLLAICDRDRQCTKLRGDFGWAEDRVFEFCKLRLGQPNAYAHVNCTPGLQLG